MLAAAIIDVYFFLTFILLVGGWSGFFVKFFFCCVCLLGCGVRLGLHSVVPSKDQRLSFGVVGLSREHSSFSAVMFLFYDITCSK